MTLSWKEKLEKATNVNDRLDLARDPDCPVDLLEMFVKYDVEVSMIIAAATHPTCPDELLPEAVKRSGWRYNMLVRKKRQNIKYHWQNKLAKTTNREDRLDLARDPDCHIELLEMFVKQDRDPLVIMEAATNPKCPTELLALAAERARINYDDLLEKRKEKNGNNDDAENEGKLAFSDRDSFLVSHILNKDNQHAEIHLGDYEIKDRHEFNKRNDTKEYYKQHIVLVICPSWGIVFPPYNLARLTGLLRHHGYKVTVFDLNIESYYVLKEKTGMNFWSSEKYHLWFNDKFTNDIWPHIQSMIMDCVEEIDEMNPDIIGFSLYNTNMWCSKTMMEMIRGVREHTPIVVGGPEASQDTVMKIVDKGIINYIFQGEAEHTFLTFLEDGKYSAKEFGVKIGSLESKLPLDDLPFPDYSDYIIEEYLHPDGVSIETSRGCIAQCSFCSETWFWKFRQRTSERVIEEMKDQIAKYGIRRFWFVDSLVNGNIKEFRRLVDLMIENKLNIRWNSYARNDGRMDRDFIFKIAQSGCTSLSFGVESGSQKVLNDMRKKIDLWEIEQNLKDCFDAGMATHINWMIGFPTEENIDFLHGMVLIANTAKYFHAISPGMGCGPAAFSDLEKAWKLYGITWKEKPFDTSFLGHWFTENYGNTQLHRFIRIKNFAIFLDILRANLGISPHNGQQYDDIKKFYELKITGKIEQTNVPNLDTLNLNLWESKDNNITEDFAANIANEYPGIMWILYKLLNCGFELKINSDPVMDNKNFGAYIAVNYQATTMIKVDDLGNYTIQVDHGLKHEKFDPNTDFMKYNFINELKVQNKSFQTSHTSQGNLNDLIADQVMVKETIHVQYRKKKKLTK